MLKLKADVSGRRRLVPRRCALYSIAGKGKQNLKIVALQSGTGLCFRHVALTEGPWERMRGFLGLKGFPVGQIMWFRPCSAIHTFFMRFSIDVVFLNRDLVVTDIRIGVKPWRMVFGSRDSFSVLEAQTGWLDPASIVIGMRLELSGH